MQGKLGLRREKKPRGKRNWELKDSGKSEELDERCRRVNSDSRLFKVDPNQKREHGEKMSG